MLEPIDRADANHVLNLWRAGAGPAEGISRKTVDRCLRITGDALGLKEFSDDGEPVLVLESRHA